MSRWSTLGCTSVGPATATQTPSASSSWTVRRFRLGTHGVINIQGEKSNATANGLPGSDSGNKPAFLSLKDNKVPVSG